MSHSGSDAEEVPQKKKEVIPDMVDSFLDKLLKALETRNIPELHKLYEDQYNKLTDKFYKQRPDARWPHADVVAEDVSDQKLFLILYKELYYRHVYSRNIATYEDRKGSWDNYCLLLELIIDELSSGEDLGLGLPVQWIWDILDEFIYHYQVYCMARGKTKKKQDKELQFFQDEANADVFSTPKVLNYLHQIIRNSRIEEFLASPDNPKGITGSSFTDETTRFLGYFGLMQLLRMHSLLGDYHYAMKTIEFIDFDEEVPLFYKIPACHVTLYYYMGFAYMMLRRYSDAIRTFSDILVFLQKTSGVNQLSYQYDQMAKKRDQMYALLLICLTLCPQSIDESLDRDIREKHGEKQARLHRGDDLIFEELFSYACPKFVSAALPDVSLSDSFDQGEAHSRQLLLFKQEVKEQQLLPRIGSCMKLYTAITTSKLSQLCEMDEEALRDTLMCVIHKTHQRVRKNGPPLTGDFKVCSEVEFYLDGDMVHINAQKTERPHTEVFLEQILKFQELLKKMGKA